MKQLLAFKLENGETLCDLLAGNRQLGIHLMKHMEFPGGIHTFEEREAEVIDLPAIKMTPEDRKKWDDAAKAKSSRKPFYHMKGSVDPDSDVYPFPPVLIFSVEGEQVEVRVKSSLSLTGDSLEMYYLDGLIASTGATMGKWALRERGFLTYARAPGMVKAALTAIRFLDEKLYDDHD